MIASNRNYPFGGRLTRIITPTFAVMISTAKEGFFSKQSTMIFNLVGDDFIDRGPPVGKIMWSSALRSGDRLNAHDGLVTAMDALGGEGYTLHDTIELIVGKMRPAGMIESAINLTEDETGE